MIYYSVYYNIYYNIYYNNPKPFQGQAPRSRAALQQEGRIWMRPPSRATRTPFWTETAMSGLGFFCRKAVGVEISSLRPTCPGCDVRLKLHQVRDIGVVTCGPYI